MENKTEISPSEYFDRVKDLKNTVTDKSLDNFYNGCLELYNKYKTTGQVKMMNKLAFITSCVEKERELVKMGINSFVYRQDIEDYIDKVHKKTIKIIELKNYPREIPDEIVKVIERTKNIFDEMYIVFTDYNGSIERTVKKERRDKDPILFGTFQNIGSSINDRNSSLNIINDRFYYLGDWIDEYCDLTLEKIVKLKGEDVVKNIRTPESNKQIIDEIKRINENMKIMNDKSKVVHSKKEGMIFRFKKSLLEIIWTTRLI